MNTPTPLGRDLVAQQVNEMLHVFCEKQIRVADECGEGYGRLWRAIDLYLAHGGKRLRPYLMLLTYQGYDGRRAQDMLPLACAWELLHAGMLVHDDIIDRDYVRHGHQNIAGYYKEMYGSVLGKEAEHYAAGAALMAGDLLLASAQRIIIESTVSGKSRLLASSYIQEALFYVAGGELMDVESILYTPLDVLSDRIAKNKTARYSFELPLACGAALAGASESEVRRLKVLGEEIGLAYQLIDDVLGVFGDTQVTGKSNNGDLREKKRTHLVQEMLRRLPGNEARHMVRMFEPDYEMNDADAHEIRQAMDKTHAKESVLQRASEHNARALQIVGELDMTTTHADELHQLINMLTKRTF